MIHTSLITNTKRGNDNGKRDDKEKASDMFLKERPTTILSYGVMFVLMDQAIVLVITPYHKKSLIYEVEHR